MANLTTDLFPRKLMNRKVLQRRERKRAIYASITVLVILYLSTPDVIALSPNGVLDSFASAVLALALSHTALLVLPRKPAIPLAALFLMSAIIYNVANGFFFKMQQTYLSVNTLYLAAEVMSFLNALSVWQLTLGLCLILIIFAVFVFLVRVGRPYCISTRFFSTLTLYLLSAGLAVSYAAITNEAYMRVIDNSPLGHMVRSSGVIPFTTLNKEIMAEKERDLLIRKLKRDADEILPSRFSAASIGLLLGYDETYGSAIENKRFPLFKKAGYTAASELSETTKATNVVLIVMESLRSSEMGVYGAEQSATPYLDKLAENNVIANRFYATANYTVKSEHAINCSTLDFMIGAPISSRGVAVRSQCLPALLHNKGYRTMWFHGNTKEFYGRTKYLRQIGFHDVYSRDELDPDKLMPTLGWGLTDETLFDEALDRLESVDEPFFAEILTVSNHIPFDYNWNIDFPEYLRQDTNMLDRYRRGMYYSDQAFRKFHERFKNSTLAKNTILVVTGDHGIWTFSSDEMSGLEKNEQYFRVPFILQTPEGHKRTVNENTSHLDIAPTLSSLLDLTGANDWMGRSLFEGEKALENRITYMMTEQALSYRYSDRACIPSVQCENSVSCYQVFEQDVPEALCFRVEKSQDLLLDAHSTPIVIDARTTATDRALFEYSQIALELGTAPEFTED